MVSSVFCMPVCHNVNYRQRRDVMAGCDPAAYGVQITGIPL